MESGMGLLATGCRLHLSVQNGRSCESRADAGGFVCEAIYHDLRELIVEITREHIGAV
jgi:hypothetical protein